jgi:hypothetical protein
MRRPSVMTFDEQRMLPEVLRAPVVDTAERHGAPVEYAAASYVVVPSAITQKAIVIQPKQLDDWRQPLNLSGTMIGASGSGKTSVAESVMRFAREKEKQWRRGHVDPGSEPRAAASASRRLFIGDITDPKLQDLGAEPQNWPGLFYYSEELLRFSDALIKNPALRARVLGATETGRYIDPLDRISRETRHASDGQSLVVFGGYTPEGWQLRMCNRQGEVVNDGLMQRFLVAVWVENPGFGKFVDTLSPDYTHLNAAYERILSLEEPLIYRFGLDAYNFYMHWWNTKLRSLTGDPDIAPALRSHFSKYRKLMAVLPTFFMCSTSRSRIHARCR